MRKRLLRVMSAGFVSWLHEEMPPAGKATLHDLEARAEVFIAALPDGGEPLLESLEKLDAPSVEAGLGWLLTMLRTAYPGPWSGLACESLRLHLRHHVDAIVTATHPPETIVQQDGEKSSSGGNS